MDQEGTIVLNWELLGAFGAIFYGGLFQIIKDSFLEIFFFLIIPYFGKCNSSFYYDCFLFEM